MLMKSFSGQSHDDETLVQVNQPNNDRDTPLHWAASGGHLECASKLIDAKANIWAA